MFVGLFLSGCATITNTVNYVKTSNGVCIVQQIDISLNKKQIQENGYDYNKIMSEIYRDELQPTGVLYSLVKKIRTDYSTRVSETFAEHETLKNQYLSGFIETVISKTDIGFSIYLSFSDVRYFLFFNKVTSGDKLIDVPFGGSITTDKEFFVTSYLQTVINPFNTWWDQTISYKGTETDFKTAIADIFESNKLEDAKNYELSNINLIFKFISPYKRLHSNADSITKSNGKYVHSWVIDPDNIDEEVVFFRTSANTGIWYLIALGGAIIFVLIGTTLYLLAKIFKKDRKKINERKN